ncbi:hypothetical protein [uncultured Campylobacter sp.]|uniref:hypothetical protein n=1 Tax=uncultured Campylobacter sp. TaxID=218934 RepID=UPI0028EAEEA1|nr:hypothetical protein [uncultured Campylobacter sp.]
MNYTNFDYLNITNPDTGGVYDFMAGGLFDGYYAGSYGYNALNLPTPDLRSFFINQAFSLTAGLLELNEDFAEFVLMPMQILILREDKESAAKLISSASEITANNAKERKTQIRQSERGQNLGRGIAGTGDINKNFRDFAREMATDSVFEKAAQTLGRTFGGVFGQIAAGMLYDGLVNGEFNTANIGEALMDELKNTLTQSALSYGLRALGTAPSLLGTFGLSLAIGTLVDEITEVIAGLDNHFGFGGELQGFDAYGAPYYDRALGFGEFFKEKFGMLDSHVELENKKGDVVGYRLQDKKFLYVDKARPPSVVRTDVVEVGRIYGAPRLGYNPQFNLGVGLGFGGLNFGYTKQENYGWASELRGALTQSLQEVQNSFSYQLNATVTAPSVDVSAALAQALQNAQTNINGDGAQTSNKTSSMEWAEKARMAQSRGGKGMGGISPSKNKAGGWSFANTKAGNWTEAGGLLGFGGAKTDPNAQKQLADEIGRQKTAQDAAKGGASGKGKNLGAKTGYGKTSRGEKSRQRQAERNSAGNRGGSRGKK